MPRLWTNWLHLATLWTLGVCLPLLQVISHSPDWLIAEHAGFPDLPLTVILLIVAPPTAVVLLEWLLGRINERAADVVQLVAVGGLVAAYAQQWLKDQFDPASLVLPVVAVAVGALFAWAYRRGRVLPLVLTVLAPAVILVPAWFMGVSDAAPIAWSANDPLPPEGPRIASTTPVVLVVFDEFSSLTLTNERGAIDAARFPNFARLAQDATWYRNATTVADGTIRAVPTILTGSLPPGGAEPVEDDQPASLFSRLRGQYGFNVHESVTYLCQSCGEAGWFERSRLHLSGYWDLLKARLRRARAPAELAGPQEATTGRIDAFHDWLGQVRGGRTLNALHFLFPHIPWWFTREGRQYNHQDTIPAAPGEIWTTNPAAVSEYLRRYVEQVRFGDRLVGELRATLERRGLWDDALVVLVADHGVAFVPGVPRRAVTPQNFAEIASVPLFVKVPHQRRGRTSDVLARTTDVVPTIGDVLGVRWAAQGRSLRGPVARSDVTVTKPDGKAVEMPRDAFLLLRAAASKRLHDAQRSP